MDSCMRLRVVGCAFLFFWVQLFALCWARRLGGLRTDWESASGKQGQGFSPLTGLRLLPTGRAHAVCEMTAQRWFAREVDFCQCLALLSVLVQVSPFALPPIQSVPSLRQLTTTDVEETFSLSGASTTVSEDIGGVQGALNLPSVVQVMRTVLATKRPNQWRNRNRVRVFATVPSLLGRCEILDEKCVVGMCSDVSRPCCRPDPRTYHLKSSQVVTGRWRTH